MRRTIPLLITSLGGLVLVASFFVPAARSWGETATVWFNILAAIAFLLGGGNLLKVHLAAIARREAGWGYSAVILASFAITLAVGLLKIGVRPEPGKNYPGETWVDLPLAALPSFEQPVPSQPELPRSVRRQARYDGPRLVVRGYLSPEQTADLVAASGDADWRCAIQTLAETASLPEEVRPFLRYRGEHDALAAIGPLLVTEAKAADALVPEDDPRYPIWHAAIVELKDASRLETSVILPPAAEVVVWPADETFPVRIETDGDVRTMTSIGPITADVREKLFAAGAFSPPAVPLASAAIDEFVARWELAGEQADAARQALAGPFTATELLAAIDGATAATTEPRPWCDIAADVAAGDRTPPLTAPLQPALALTDDQRAAITEAVEAGGTSGDQMMSVAAAAGPFDRRQAVALADFYEALPSEADRRRDLAMTLLRIGPLDRDTIDRLLDPYRRRRAWHQAVASLDQRSQRIKFPWAADYNREGSAFWWIYEYLFRPLTATIFAMLAFYISSAAFRAFRAKNLEASLLLGTALVVLLGRIILGTVLTGFIPPDSGWAFLRLENLTESWIMKVFTTAGNRAIMIGIALGIVSTSLKVLLGLDRSYLGE